MVFVRNPNYVPRSEPADGLAGGKRVKLDRVEWRYMPDANTSTSALKNGEVDIVNVVPPDYQAALRTDANVRLAQTGIWQPFMVANTLAPPFNNPKARAALLHLVNQEEIDQRLQVRGAFAEDLAQVDDAVRAVAGHRAVAVGAVELVADEFHGLSVRRSG